MTLQTQPHNNSEFYFDDPENAQLKDSDSMDNNNDVSVIPENYDPMFETIEKLIDQIHTKEDARKVITEISKSPSISADTLKRLSQADNSRDKAYEGTIDNLLTLARSSEALTHAVENYPEYMLKEFSSMRIRYALLNEPPKNHASFLYFVCDIETPEITKELSVIANMKRKRFENAKKFMKRKEQAKANLSTHDLNIESLSTIIRKSIPKYARDSIIHFSDKAYVGINFKVTFDANGDLSISSLSPAEKQERFLFKR